MNNSAPVALPESADMITGDRSYPTLNVVRAIGATMVVTTHVGFDTGRILEGWTGAVIARMDFGVTIFFVLSGFLLARPFFVSVARQEPRPSIPHYLWKRGLRVLPLYWVVVAAAMLLDPRNADLGWDVWIQQLTFSQLYNPGVLPHSLTQMWSLATEVAFYILLPVIVLLLTWSRKPGLNVRTVAWRLAVLCLLGLAWQTYYATIPGFEGHQGQWLPGYFAWFGVGMLYAAVTAAASVRPRVTVLDRWGKDLTGCWLLATAFFALACTPLAGPLTLELSTAWAAGFKSVLYTLAGAFYLLPLIFGPEREGKVREFMSRPGPSWLGEISYGIFCIHLLMLNLSLEILRIEVFTGRFALVWATTMVLTIAASALAYRYLEKPALHLKNVGPFARRP